MQRDILSEVVRRLTLLEQEVVRQRTRETISRVGHLRDVMSNMILKDGDLLVYNNGEFTNVHMSALQGADGADGTNGADGTTDLGAMQDATLSGDAFAISGSYRFYNVISETGTTDDLATISGGADGMLIVLRPTNGHTITVVETGNLHLSGTLTMDDRADKLMLVYDPGLAGWCEVSFVSNA